MSLFSPTIIDHPTGRVFHSEDDYQAWRQYEQSAPALPAGWPSPGPKALPPAMRAPQQSLPFRAMNREEPVQVAKVESHVLVPALWALITGTMLTLLLASALLVLWPDVWGVAFWIGALVAFIQWLARMGSLEIVLWKVESITGHDLSGDGQVGKPTPVRIEVTERNDNGGRMSWLDVPVPQESVATFARGLSNGIPLAREHWCGNGKLFSRKEFEGLVDRLLELGWARPRAGGRRQGLELTAAGRAIMSKLSLAGVGRQAGGNGNDDDNGE